MTSAQTIATNQSPQTQNVPPIVDTTAPLGVPSDAIILFAGLDLREWIGENSAAPSWIVADGILTVKCGSGGIVTKRNFGDCQLHIEWRTPAKVEGDGQARGNSGIFFQRRYEVQILDSFENPTYPDGQAGAVYKQQPPLVNASRPPGHWQTFDIVFRAPRFDAKGQLLHPPVITVFQNGVLVQDHAPIQGITDDPQGPRYVAHPLKQPLLLQDHGSAVSFRNIWLRELAKSDAVGVNAKIAASAG
ncbi:MAG: DUF1080 domain-containing protein [Nibricoccus sp.]